MPAAMAGQEPPRWTAKWDRAVLLAAVERMDARFDPAEMLISQKIGPEYHYHTSLRNTTAHLTRDSLDYALLLLETGEEQRRRRGMAILDRILTLQDTDTKSQWYGLWGYYLEEPASKMSPADWNWADFLGAVLVTIEFRHGARFAAPLRDRLLQAIRHSAQSVRKRNVAMTYTNIAVQGTFVTLMAAELLNDADLKQYATERLVRFARTVDETGSFAEYNSPTYANVTIANLTRMRMFVKDLEARKLAARLETRAWIHLSRHWHPPTRQLAGPMSRCYQTDIGYPAWIQKALGGAIPFFKYDEIGKRNVPGEVALVDYRCSEDAIGWFLSLGMDREHGELFANAPAGVRPVQGTTFLSTEFCLGSVNRGNFWVQSRPLAAYWGGADRPARYLQARLLKDDYDFASGLLYSTQVKNYVLGVATFRWPGGDKHPSLDPVKDGEFTCSRLRLRFDLAQVPANAPVLVNGELAELGEFPPASRVVVDLGGTLMWLQVLRTVCGEVTGAVTVAREDDLLTLSVDFLKRREPQTIRWPRIAYCAFALALHDAEGSLEDYDKYVCGLTLEHRIRGDVVTLDWDGAWAELEVQAAVRVGDVAAMDRAFMEKHDGRPVPVQRLSSVALV